MRPALFSFLLIFLFSSAGAQRFYYLETSNLVDQLLKTRLEKANQYVVPSAIGSEYTVRTKIESGDNSNELNLEIVLADSLTQKEIFRSYEQICFTHGTGQPLLRYGIAIRQFVQRRIGELMLMANQDHFGLYSQELKERKDKT